MVGITPCLDHLSRLDSVNDAVWVEIEYPSYEEWPCHPASPELERVFVQSLSIRCCQCHIPADQDGSPKLHVCYLIRQRVDVLPHTALDVSWDLVHRIPWCMIRLCSGDDSSGVELYPALNLCYWQLSFTAGTMYSRVWRCKFPALQEKDLAGDYSSTATWGKTPTMT